VSGVPDAVVVGSGPNGLAAAVRLALAGVEVTVLEGQPVAGGGARTLDLELAPGVRHDVCSAVHPMAWASPFLRSLDLGRHGVELLMPSISYGQPLDDGRAGLAHRDLDRTVAGLGEDGPAWRRLLGPLARHAQDLAGIALGDRRHLPGHRAVPTALRLAAGVLEQGSPAWGLRFRSEVAPALLTGVAAHAVTTLPSLPAAGTALVLAALAHAGSGWPIVRGGSGAITAALQGVLESYGGVVVTGHPVRSGRDLPQARVRLFDTPPRTVARVLADELPATARRALERHRHGNAAAKVDFVLDGPVPWRNEELRSAGTVHLGGTRAQMRRVEADVAAGRHPDLPVCLVSDPAAVDPTRVSGGLRPLWSYAHVPAGSPVDVTDSVIRQIERFAPGFRDVIVASRCTPAARMAHHNANYVGGDFAGGALTTSRILGLGGAGLDPFETGVPGAFLCSSSAPPGPGVHGMAGVHAAERALRYLHHGRTGRG
jgi:phytoene dehydrogenase-like protein